MRLFFFSLTFFLVCLTSLCVDVIVVFLLLSGYCFSVVRSLLICVLFVVFRSLVLSFSLSLNIKKFLLVRLRGDMIFESDMIFEKNGMKEEISPR